MPKLQHLREKLKWKLVPAREKKRVLDEALAVLRRFPPTAEMLKTAEDEGVTIGFNAALIGTAVGGRVVDEIPQEGKGCRRVELAPSLSPATIAGVLIHELRHVMQMQALGVEPGTGDAADPDPRFSLLLTRVKEADAYAFADVTVACMNRYNDILSRTAEAAHTLARAEGVAEFSRDNIARAVKIASAQQEDAPPMTAETMKKDLAKKFRETLASLGGYDAAVITGYHARYTDPSHAPDAHRSMPDGKTLGVADAKELLFIGGAPYIGDIEDKAFEDLVLAGVAPDVLKTASLMADFEQAAAKGTLSPADNRARREAIDHEVRALAERPEKGMFRPERKTTYWPH